MRIKKSEIKKIFKASSHSFKQKLPKYLKTIGHSKNQAESVLKIIFSSRFRKGSLKKTSLDSRKDMFLKLVKRRLTHNKPIQLTFLACPFKVPNPLKIINRRLPDLAEVGLIAKMGQLNEAIKCVYPSGVEIILIHDGLFYRRPFNVSYREVIEYRTYFRQILKALEVDYITSVDLMELFKLANENIEKTFKSVEPKLSDWLSQEKYVEERHEAYGLTLNEMMAKDVQVKDFSKAIKQFNNFGFVLEPLINKQVWDSVKEYKKRELALYEIDPRGKLFPEAIHASAKYRKGRLSMWLIKEGHAILPWHGVGILKKDGSIRVGYEPAIIESGKFKKVFLEKESTPFYYQEL